MIKRRLLSGLCIVTLVFNLLTLQVLADEPTGGAGGAISIDVEKSKVVLEAGGSETIGLLVENVPAATADMDYIIRAESDDADITATVSGWSFLTLTAAGGAMPTTGTVTITVISVETIAAEEPTDPPILVETPVQSATVTVVVLDAPIIPVSVTPSGDAVLQRGAVMTGSVSIGVLDAHDRVVRIGAEVSGTAPAGLTIAALEIGGSYTVVVEADDTTPIGTYTIDVSVYDSLWVTAPPLSNATFDVTVAAAEVVLSADTARLAFRVGEADADAISFTLEDPDAQAVGFTANTTGTPFTAAVAEGFAGEGTYTLEIDAAGLNSTHVGVYAIVLQAYGAASEVVAQKTIDITVLPEFVAHGLFIDTSGLESFYMDSAPQTIPVSITDGNGEPVAISGVQAESNDPAISCAYTAGTDGGDLTLTPTGLGTAPTLITITVTVTNAAGKVTIETFPVTVLPALVPPVFVSPGLVPVTEDAFVTVNLDDYMTIDAANPIAVDSFTVNGAVVNGTASISGSNLTFTPTPDYCSVAGNTATYGGVSLLFSYTKYGVAYTEAILVEFDINGVEDAPVAVDDAVSGVATMPITLSVSDILFNDTTVERSALVLTKIGGEDYVPNTEINIDNANVSYTANQAYKGTLAVTAGGDIVFTPNIRYEGVVTLSYTVKNELGLLTDEGEITFTVVRGTDAPPQITSYPASITVAEDAYVSTAYTFEFRVTDTDIMDWDDAVVSIAGNNSAILASCTLDTPVPDGEDCLIYTASLWFVADAYTGADNRYGDLTITLTASDGSGSAAVTQDIAVTITPQNDAPVLTVKDDTFSGGAGDGGAPALITPGGTDMFDIVMHEDTTAKFDFVLSDVDMPLVGGNATVAGYNYSLSITGPAGADTIFAEANITRSAASMLGNQKASYTLTLQPKPNANTEQGGDYPTGPVVVTIQITDPSGASTILTTLTITVKQVNDKPVAGSILNASTLKNQPVFFPVLEQYTDADNGDSSDFGTINVQSPTAYGTAVVTTQAGVLGILYTPNHNAAHVGDEIKYTITDLNGSESEQATIKVNLVFINYQPEIFFSTAVGLTSDNPIVIYEDSGLFELPFTIDDEDLEPEELKVASLIIANSALLASTNVAAGSTDDERVLQINTAPHKNSYDGTPAHGNLVQIQIQVSDMTPQVNKDTTIWVRILPVNDRPTTPGSAIVLSYPESTSIVVNASTFVEACDDVDISEGDAIYFIDIQPQGALKGSISGITSETEPNAGDPFTKIKSFEYIPPQYHDVDTVFTYTIRDKVGGGAPITGTFILRPIKVNDSPVFEELPEGKTQDDFAQTDEDTPYHISVRFKDPETLRKNLILTISSDNQAVINSGSLSYIITDDDTDEMDSILYGADITITPLADMNSDEPVKITITVSDGTNNESRELFLKVVSIPDAPTAPTRDFLTNESTPLTFNLAEECLDVDGDIVTVAAADIVFVSYEEDGNVITAPAPLPGTIAVSGENVTFSPEQGFNGCITFSYTAEDSFHGQAYTIANGDVEIHDGRTAGTFTIRVGSTEVGPSLKRLAPVVAYAGQKLPVYALETREVFAGDTYTIKVEVLGAPVEPGSFALDGISGSQWTFTAGGNEPMHALTYKLKAGVSDGDGIVRMTITGMKDGETTVNTMSFRVSVHDTNRPPTMLESVNLGEIPERVGAAYNVLEIDLIDLADIFDHENETIRFSNITPLGGGIGSDLIRTKFENGRNVLVYEIRDARSAAGTGLHTVQFQYSIYDEGGAEGIACNAAGNMLKAPGVPWQEGDGESAYLRTGIVTLTIKAENHAPYTNGYIMTGTRAADNTVTINNVKAIQHSHDRDGDTRFLNAVSVKPGSESIINSVGITGTGEIEITANAGVGGWATIYYDVYSYFANDTNNTKDISGRSEIHIYIPPTVGDGGGFVPPMAGGDTHYIEEDQNWSSGGSVWIDPSNTAEHDPNVFGSPSAEGYFRVNITSWLFGDTNGCTNPDLGIQMGTVQNNPANQRLADAAVGKVTMGTTNTYYIYYKLTPNGNSYLDATGNTKETEQGRPAIPFTIWNISEHSNPTVAPTNGTVTATSQLGLRIWPVNDLPVLEGSGFTIDYREAPAILGDSSVAKSQTAVRGVDNVIRFLDGGLEKTFSVVRGETATLQFRVTDLDYPTADLCSAQINVAFASDTSLVIAPNKSVIAPPAPGSDIWTITFKGQISTADSQVVTLSVKVYDEMTEASLVTAQILVKVMGENNAPDALDHWAVIDEDTPTEIKIAYMEGTVDDSDKDGDEVTIVPDLTVLSPAEAAALAQYGSFTVLNDRIVFSPSQDIFHSEIYPKVSSTFAEPLEFADAPDAQWVKIPFRLKDPLGLESSPVAYVYVHINPVNDAPRFVGLNKEQQINERDIDNDGTVQTIKFTVRDVEDYAFTKDNFGIVIGDGTDDAVLKSAEVIDVSVDSGRGYVVTVAVTPKYFKNHATIGGVKEMCPLHITVSDQHGASHTETIRVYVMPVDNPPRFVKDGGDAYDGQIGLAKLHGSAVYSNPIRFATVEDGGGKLVTAEDTQIAIDVTAYFIDPDTVKLNLIKIGDAKHGTVENVNNQVVFKPAVNYFTPEGSTNDDEFGSFTYIVSDGASVVSGRVYIDITPVNDAPVASDKSYPGVEDTPVSIEDLFTAPHVRDVDNLQAELWITEAGAFDGEKYISVKGGTVEIKQSPEGYDWHILYTPAENVFGNDSFDYTVSDGFLTDTKTITINIAGVNDAPVVTLKYDDGDIRLNPDDSENVTPFTFDEDTIGKLKYTVVDPEGSNVIVTASMKAGNPTNSNCSNMEGLFSVTNGVVTNSSGSLFTTTMSPKQDAYGDFYLELQVDDMVNKTKYVIPVRVLPVNDVPKIDNQAFFVNEDASIANEVLVASDVETAAVNLKFETVAGYEPQRGTVTYTNNKFTYVPYPNYFGTDTFTVRVTDRGATNANVWPNLGAGRYESRTDTAVITITIAPKNDNPLAPTSVSLNAEHYGGSDTIAVSWVGGTDMFNETKQADIKYEVGYTIDPAGTATPVQLVNGANGVTLVIDHVNRTATITGLATTMNTSSLRIYVRTVDDGKAYEHLGKAEAGAPDGVANLTTVGAAQGILRSAWVPAAAVKVDSTAPTASPAASKTTPTNDTQISINVNPNKGALDGVSDIAKVEWRLGTSGAFTEITADGDGKYLHAAAYNGTYYYQITDGMGNVGTAQIIVSNLDRIDPSATVSSVYADDKAIGDAPALTLASGDAVGTLSGAPANAANELASGVVKLEYQLLSGSRSAYDPAGTWVTYATSVVFPAKGTYTLFTRVTDAAGNVRYQLQGEYTVLNTPPIAVGTAVTLYEHGLDAVRKSEETAVITASDADAADNGNLQFTLLSDAERDALEAYVTITEVSGMPGQYTFAHKGGNHPDATKVYTLTVKVEDAEGAQETVTIVVTLKGINDVPTAPTAFQTGAGVPTHFRHGDAIGLTWGISTDEETDSGDIIYKLQYGLGVTPAAVLADVTGALLANPAVPGGSGYNGSLFISIYAQDDNSSNLNLDGTTTGRASSSKMNLPVVYIDNTAPAISGVTFTPQGNGKSTALVAFTATESNVPWQSGVDRVDTDTGVPVLQSKVSIEGGFTYTYLVDVGAEYEFKVYDNVGNYASLLVDAQPPAEPVINYTDTHVNKNNTINISWTHTGDTGCIYELQGTDGSVTEDGETVWFDITLNASQITGKSRAYAVADFYAMNFSDTEMLRFRVRAVNAKGLSGEWSAGADVVCDSTPPVITLTPDVAAAIAANTDITVTCDIADAMSGVAKVVSHEATDYNGTGVLVWTQDYVVTTVGTTVMVTATDRCGNSSTKSYTVSNIDKAAPGVAVVAVSDSITMAADDQVDHPIDFTLSFIDDGGFAELAERKYAITQTDIRPADGDAAWISTDENSVSAMREIVTTYYVHMYAKDSAGNEVYQVFGLYEIINTIPLAEDIEVTVLEGEAVAIQLAGDPRDVGDSIVLYEILPAGVALDGTLGDGMLVNPEDILDVFAGSVSGLYRFVHSGADPIRNESFTYRVKDGLGSWSLPATVTVVVEEVNEAPTIAAAVSDTVTIVWDSPSAPVYFDVFDPDNRFADMIISFASDTPGILPIESIRTQKTVPGVDNREGQLALILTPLAGQYTQSGPVTITITVRDPEGLTSSMELKVTVIAVPTPPKANDQYYIVLKNGEIDSAVEAGLGKLGQSLSYVFGSVTAMDVTIPSAPVPVAAGMAGYGAFTPAADGAFNFKAGAQFEAGVVVEVPVTVTQLCADGTFLSTAITLYIRPEAVTFENTPRSKMVTVVPAPVSLNSASDLVGAKITSDQLGILNPAACRLYLDGANQLVMEYSHVEYCYGRVNITITLADSTTIELPIVILPVNNAPEVAKGLSERIPMPADGVGSSVPMLGMMSPFMGASATVNVAETADAGEAIKGTLLVTDSKDARPNHSGIYEDSYECDEFQWTIMGYPANGSLVLEQDGFGNWSYLYTPYSIAFAGTDTFYILVSEDKHFDENRNPSALEVGVLDAGTSGSPNLLARMVRVSVTVNAPDVPTLPPIDPGHPFVRPQIGKPPVVKDGESLFTARHDAYIFGYSDGTVRPEEHLTRAEAAAVFYRLLTETAQAQYHTTVNPFDDVHSYHWYNTAVSVMAGMKIVYGLPDGSFGAERLVTRGELAVILARFAEYQKTPRIKAMSFTDIAGHWGEASILYAAEAGWISGHPDGSFHPADHITRAEFIAMINRMTGRLPESAGDLLHDGMIVWPDNAPNKWYYLHVQEATNSHEYIRKGTHVPGSGYSYETWVKED